MFSGFGFITAVLLSFGALVSVRCDRIVERQVEEALETRDGVTVPVRRVVQEGRVDVSVQLRLLGLLAVRTERLGDVVQAGIVRQSRGVSRPGTRSGADPQLRLVLRDGRVWTSQPVGYAVGTPLTEMVERIQEFLDRSAAPSLRLWWMQWVMSALGVPFLLVCLLFVAAGLNMARRQLGLGAS